MCHWENNSEATILESCRKGMPVGRIVADLGNNFSMKNKNGNNESMMAMFASDSHVLGGVHKFPAVNPPGQPIYAIFDHSEGASEPEEVSEENTVKHVEKKRRLTNVQVMSLEMSFETDGKLEPDRKNQLAQELGLQPRQVAIWFQNRRARCKTKQLERDYISLKEQYDAVLDEKDRLEAQVLKLNELLQMQGEECRKKENETSQVTINNKAQDEEEQEENQGTTTKPRKDGAISSSLHSDDAVFKQKQRQEAEFSSRTDQSDVLDASSPDEQQQNIAHVLDTSGQHLGKVPMERLTYAAPYLHRVKVEESYSHPEELYNNGFFALIEEQAAMLCFDWPN